MRYPKLIRQAKTPVRVVIFSEDCNEFNERLTLLDKTFKCNYQDSARLRYTADKQSAEITGTLLIDGDITISSEIESYDFAVRGDGVLVLMQTVTEDSVLKYSNDPVENESDLVITGYVVIFGRKRRIVKGTKARNPDGTVNYTRIEVS